MPPVGLPPEISLPGTISVSGPAWQSPTITGVGTDFTQLTVGQGISILWTLPEGTVGEMANTIKSITDATHATLWSSIDTSLYPSLSGVQMNELPPQYAFWGQDSASNNWNYYDNALGYYRLYYETGIDDYLNQARFMADRWYVFSLDGGYSLPYPRIAALQGMMLRANDGHPEYWNGLMRYMNGAWGGWYNQQFTQTFSSASAVFQDPRENGYELRWAALISKIHPDPTIRSTWCGYVAHSVTQAWAVWQDDLGQLETDPYNQNPTYPYIKLIKVGMDPSHGSRPWRF